MSSENKNKLSDSEKLSYLKQYLLMITHELKQPLTPIIGYAGIIKSHLKDDNDVEYMQRIISSAFSMRDLINKLLTLFKLESNVLEYNFKLYNISSIINDSLITKVDTAGLKKIRIIKKLRNFYVNVDYERMKDVIINLIDNALKFSKNNSLIEIRVWDDKTKVYFSVRDEGPGIKKEELSKLFVKFYQTDLGKMAGGTGVGLSMIKYIIEAHKGNIEVKSVLGKGSEFIISLPKNDSKKSKEFIKKEGDN